MLGRCVRYLKDTEDGEGWLDWIPEDAQLECDCLDLGLWDRLD
jgi:hypothetical protein